MTTTSICDEFYLLIREMTKGDSFVSPNTFLSAIWKVLPSFKGYKQQDAQEFMRCLLDRMDYELQEKNKKKGISSKPSDQSSLQESQIGTLFGGLLQNEITCLKCGHISRKDDPFLDLSLDVPEDEYETSITLMDCLKSFTDIEVLEETEKYHCEKCLSLQRISKKFSIKRAPEVSRVLYVYERRVFFFEGVFLDIMFTFEKVSLDGLFSFQN
jgi:ubiquitin carboxyl-terminal hydrolase 3